LKWSGTHIARHTFATLALISERDLGAVQAALGHANQRITASYAKIVALQSSKITSNVANLIGLSRSDSHQGTNRGQALQEG
jgi:integrase